MTQPDSKVDNEKDDDSTDDNNADSGDMNLVMMMYYVADNREFRCH